MSVFYGHECLFTGEQKSTQNTLNNSVTSKSIIMVKYLLPLYTVYLNRDELQVSVGGNKECVIVFCVSVCLFVRANGRVNNYSVIADCLTELFSRVSMLYLSCRVPHRALERGTNHIHVCMVIFDICISELGAYDNIKFFINCLL